MDGVARWPGPERKALFREAAARAGLASELVVEKDFWVCWTLKRLFALVGIPRLLLKGGTSLSKGFGLIERFSEDIDLALDRAALGFAAGNDPAAMGSRKGYQKAVRKLEEATLAFLAGPFLELIRRDFAEGLQGPADLDLDAQAPDTILFRYPRSAEGASAAGRYLAPMVRLELGARSDPEPSRTVSIRPYAAEHVPEMFLAPSCEVVAQAPERTLVEKALLLHSVNQRSAPSRERVSRHVYDLVLMQRAGVLRLVDRQLLEAVAHHKLVFADDKAASIAPSEGIVLVPTSAEGLERLRQDYRSMREMFFREPPSFEALLEELGQLEQALNVVGRG